MKQRKRQPERPETLDEALGTLVWRLQEPPKPPDKPVEEFTWEDVGTLLRRGAWLQGYTDEQFEALAREVAAEHGGRMDDERCAECQADEWPICWCSKWEPIPQITEVYIPIRDDAGTIIGTRREVHRDAE